MKAKGPGPAIQSPRRRSFLVRSAVLGAATLLSDTRRVLTAQQPAAPDAATTEQKRQAIDRKIVKIIVEHLGVDEKQVVPSARFIEDLSADSLDLTELVMAMEEEFDIEIDCDEAATIKTVGDAMRVVHTELDKHRPSWQH
jgi:acyl carrier protein